MPMVRILLLTLLLAAAVALPARADEVEARARRLINELGCKACHNFERSGSNLAPSLNRIGTRLSLQQLRQRMAVHQAAVGKDFRPDYANLPAEDMDTILLFLAGQR